MTMLTENPTVICYMLVDLQKHTITTVLNKVSES